MLVNSYFSQSHNIQDVIIRHLDGAQKSIYVAVAWFTNQVLFEKLVALQRQGVSVSLITTKHDINDASSIDYSEIERNGGFYAALENDVGLMHNKFCVVDNSITINGSYNWTYAANKSNQENITVISEDPKTAIDFLQAFRQLKELTGLSETDVDSIGLSKTLQYFTLIKTFISLGETKNIYQYLGELRTREDMQQIVDSLVSGDFNQTLELITEFEQKHSQLINASANQKAYLSYQIMIISHQIEFLDIEKAEVESLITQFNHRYIIELNPLISRVLAMKKKVYQKLKERGLDDDTYENLNEEFRTKNEEYERESGIEIPILTSEEAGDIKKMHREAAKLCHPDSPLCIYKDKAEAALVFSSLTDALKKNDISRVRLILSELKLGNKINADEGDSDLIYLQSKLESLKMKLSYLSNEVQSLKTDGRYLLVSEITDWDKYFEEQKALLQEELGHLNDEFGKHE